MNFNTTFKSRIKKALHNVQIFKYARRHDDVKSLIRKINLYSRIHKSKMIKFKKEINFLNKTPNLNPLQCVFPYPFSSKYVNLQVKVKRDPILNLFYVMLGDRRLYYSRNFNTTDQVVENFRFLCCEQDPESPHRYLTQNFQIEDGSVIVDIGGAEGNFSLSAADAAKKLFIFEADPIWIEALNATFEPWKHKVSIVQGFVGDATKPAHISLDQHFSNQHVDFVKIDAEGAELDILNGAKNLFRTSPTIKIDVCTYHNKNDAAQLATHLEASAFDISHSPNFMLFIYDKTLTPPYFRSALIRAERKNKALDPILVG